MQSTKLISGQSVRFKLKNAVCPDFIETVRAMGPELQVVGNIVFFSDGGNQQDRFAIVEVSGIHAPLIVPVGCLESVSQVEGEPSWPAIENPARTACEESQRAGR
ncbi:MAG: hypothetical protein V2A79_18855 [Planctomycetota bacterium]